MKKCLVNECNNKYKSIGLCSSHWKINKKYGTPEPKCFCGKAVQTFAGNIGARMLCNWHSFENRYWENVNKKTINECWEWIGSKTSAGYGIIFFNGKSIYAHRAIFLLLQKNNIAEELIVCHKCDNPSCINPKHLFIGTQKDNIEDMINKKRNRYGENTYNAKLSNEDVLQIRKLNQDGIKQKDIAKIFNIDAGHISDIINMKKRRIS